MSIFRFFKFITIVLLLFTGTNMGHAVSVTFYVDEENGEKMPLKASVAEQNLASVLEEVNRAQAANTYISNRGLKMTDFAKKAMESIYADNPFYCPEDYVDSHLWVYSKGFEARNIPIIIKHKGEAFGDETFALAVAEFDNNGVITDFRLQLSSHSASRWQELNNDFNEVEDIEQQHVILSYLEQFRTAYNKKDIATIENMFSDDALIITGHVTQRVSQGDRRMMTPQVTYNKQTKQQYIANLKRAFTRNKFIRVEFKNQNIKRSTKNPTMFGIRLDQSWKSSNYSDEGVLFLIWQFREGEDPIIHVRTWQPSESEGMKLEINDDISTLAGFDL